MSANALWFPVAAGGKRPLTEHGFKDASDDPTVTAMWRQQFPGANVGMPTGAVSGYDVLDLDVKDGRNGRKTLADLEAIHGAIENAPTVSTPSGGLHIYFQHHEGMRNSAECLPGIDIRGDGGYVVTPPSSIGGKRYEWVHGLDPELLPAPKWPAWLLAAVVKKPTERGHAEPRQPQPPAADASAWGRAALAGIHDDLAAVGVGSRDDRRNKAAFRLGQLVAGGSLSEDDAIEAGVSACERNGLLDDLGEAEVRKRMARGISDGIAAGPRGPAPRPVAHEPTAQPTEPSPSTPAPTDWPDPEPLDAKKLPEFPVDALPSWMAEWVAAEAEAVQVPAALPACVALGVASLALARADVRIDGGGWVEPTNLYLAVAMDSGNRKSPVFKAATRPIVEWEKEIAARYGAQVAKINATHDAVAEQLKSVKSEYARGKNGTTISDVHRVAEELEKTPTSSLPRLFTSDVTSERLGSMLGEQGGALGVLSAEGGLFETIAGRYADGVANLDVWLNGHSGDPIRVDRGSRPAVAVDNPRVTVVLTFQEEVLTGLGQKDGFAGRGLLARFGFAVPKSTLGKRAITPTPMPASVDAEYARQIVGLLEMARPMFDTKPRALITLTLDPPAQLKFVQLRESIEPRLGEDGDLAGIKSWVSKYAGFVLRVAAILHTCQDRNTRRQVGMETMERAIRIGEFFLDHARGAFDVMGADPAIEKARLVLRWLQTHPNIADSADEFEGNENREMKIDRRTLFNGVRGNNSLSDVESVESAISVLVESGWIRRLQASRTPTAGRPASPVFSLHPKIRSAESAKRVESPPRHRG